MRNKGIVGASHKICTLCKALKRISEFYEDKRVKDQHMGKCIPCFNKYQGSWKGRNRDRARAIQKKWYENSQNRITRTGLTIEEYNECSAMQNNVCAICKQPETMVIRGLVRPLHIDHDHVSGKFRGLLCS